ncbi:Nucleotidylyl transferase [Wallemia mellicola]|nr:Nucleotidylyl transferase [Wallemia mellicola]TIC41243.1 Nucleotidylyl transferase [Wallemia mellicola]TIC59021.1 Nucleotidylyl transferase [Wallemia mellicola]
MRSLIIAPLPDNLNLNSSLTTALQKSVEKATDVGLIFTGELPRQSERHGSFTRFQAFLIEIYSTLIANRKDKSNWWAGNIDVWFESFWQSDWMYKARLTDWDIMYTTSDVLSTISGSKLQDIPIKQTIEGLEGVKIGKHKPDNGGIYDTIALGGTFDHLHAGHKVLLSLAAYISRKKVVIGVTGPDLLTRKNDADVLESIETRKAAVDGFLKRLRPDVEAYVFTLNDVYGPTGDDEDIDAIVVSRETLSGSDAINKKRKENKIKELDVFMIELVDHTAELKLSSTDIRKYIKNTV